MRFRLQLIVILLVIAHSSFGQISAPSEVQDTTFCEISRDPAAFNHRLVRLTGFVTHGFEDFQLSDPDCPTQGFSIWLMYGGKAESGTMYCCPGEAAGPTRKASLRIDDIEIPLVDDQAFQGFRRLLGKEADTVVQATLVGRFFAGRKTTQETTAYWNGYGHLGCCSLLAIQQIDSFVPHDRSDLDYTAAPGHDAHGNCKEQGERDLLYASPWFDRDDAQRAISEQQAADNDQEWRFTDVDRVARESLQRLYPNATPSLAATKTTAAREVFRWRNRKKLVVVVVARPYWLSAYAKSGSVAWITTMVREVDCR